jgi:hypothetical protein
VSSNTSRRAAAVDASERLYRALTYPLLSARTAALAVGIALGTYVLLVASADPSAFAAAVAVDVAVVPDLVVAATLGTYRAAGWLGLALTVAYAVLAGVATVVVAASVRNGAGGTRGLLGVAPGVLAAGCATCGAGLLPLLGVTGAYALFPYAGNLVRALGLAAVVLALARTGDPRVCRA